MRTVAGLFVVACVLLQQIGTQPMGLDYPFDIDLDGESFEARMKMAHYINFHIKMWQSVEKVSNEELPYPLKCTECFKALGCFDACNGVFHYVHMLPETPKQINTTFRLYPW